MNRHRALEVTAFVVIMVAATALRLTSPGGFIASDELRWTCRSVNFMSALAERDPAGTFQVGHPGVLTMWLGGLALPRAAIGPWRDLCRVTDGGSDLDTFDDVGHEGELQTIRPLLFGARRGIAVGTVALLAVLYLLMRRGADVPAGAALAGLGMLAFDPFLLAHSRVLHVDALVALLSTVAVVALVAQAQRPGRVAPAFAAGIPAVLAVLAKSSALVLAPFAVLLMASRVWSAKPRRRALDAAARDLGGWCLGAAVAAFAVWPALAAGPVDTVRRLLAKTVDEGTAPHQGGNFFLGRPVDDPGPLFYPIAGLFRVTPIGLAAIVTAVVLVAASVYARRLGQRRAAVPRTAEHGGRSTAGSLRAAVEAAAVGPEAKGVAALVAWAVVFGLAVTIGPKKFDRYLLPSLAALNLAGGLALAAVAGQLRARRAAPVGAVVAGMVALQLVIAARSLPYSLDYYNPLVGGPATAVRTILVGWGEGYDLAADYLNQQPDAQNLEVAVPGVANFAPLFVGRTRSAEGYRPGRTDFVVLYVSKVQRMRNSDMLDDFANLEPIWVGEIAGIPFVSVYDNPTLAPLRAALAGRVTAGDVVVADAESAFARHFAGPGTLLKSWGHWGEAELREAAAGLPAGWNRVWVVRYPQHDPDAALQYFRSVATAGPTEPVAGGVVEITPFTRDQNGGS